MDPQLTKDGKPYGPARFKELVKERYLISKNMNTSYEEVGRMTPIERKYIIEFMVDEIKREKELIEKKKQEQKVKR